jgi:hypothetical protein
MAGKDGCLLGPSSPVGTAQRVKCIVTSFGKANKANSDPRLVEAKATSFLNIHMEGDEESNGKFIGNT